MTFEFFVSHFRILPKIRRVDVAVPGGACLLVPPLQRCTYAEQTISRSRQAEKPLLQLQYVILRPTSQICSFTIRVCEMATE